MVEKKPRLPWIFVDGSTQQSFRIRLGGPEWAPTEDGEDPDDAVCDFHITGDDGTVFSFRLQIVSDVLDENEVGDSETLLSLIQQKGVEIVEGAIHKGIRGDQALVWESDGISVVNRG